MDAALVVLLCLAAAGASFWVYFRREPPVRGRTYLALLRAGSLVLLVLLLWNPTLPSRLGGDGVAAPGVLIDASLSMEASRALERGSAPSTPWRAARERALELAGRDASVLLFGSSVRTTPADSLNEAAPGDPGSSLAPALERVAALGGRSVSVLSDFRLEDPVAVSSVLESTGLTVRFEDVGGRVRNAGIAEIRAPASLAAGEEGTVEVLLSGDAGAGDEGNAREAMGDSVALELRGGGRLLAALRVPLPAPGRTVSHALGLTAPEESGPFRIEVSASLEGDGFGPDDRRIAVLDVDPDREGLVLLSLRPDWEPRYLLPVLQQVTGLESRGFLRLPGGRWLPMGAGELGSGTVAEEQVRREAGEAGFLALHGVGATAPPWAGELASRADRLLLFPDDSVGAAVAGVSARRWQEGEWYADGELPSSPLAGDLAGIGLEGLPPLTALLPVAEPASAGRVPLRLRRGRGGVARPAVVLVPGDDRRAAVVPAAGFWRWASRDGAPREAYRRLWSGVSGWLLEGPREETAAGIEPIGRLAPRGAPVEWAVRGAVGDTLRIRLTADEDEGGAPGGSAADSVVLDTTVARAGSRVRTRVLPPGRYRYRIEAPGLDEDPTGVLEVSPFSDELLRPRVEPPGVAAEDGGVGAADGPGRPLRTHPAPFLLLIAFLCAEWIGRRRQGLR